MDRNRVQGLVVGTRKSGTTWLYENLKNDPFFSLSSMVKESGYFGGYNDIGLQGYLQLYGDTSKCMVEVDTSVCYSDEALSRILEHNPKMRVVIIFRNPAQWLRSRYTHSFRKGEVTEDNSTEALANHLWLRDELDYSSIQSRFSELSQNAQLLCLPFELLVTNPQSFYNSIAGFIAGDESYIPIQVDANIVNQSRRSVNNTMSSFLSRSAKYARKLGLHNLVNYTKAVGVHRLLERKTQLEPGGEEISAEQSIVNERFLSSRLLHEKLLKAHAIAVRVVE